MNTADDMKMFFQVSNKVLWLFISRQIMWQFCAAFFIPTHTYWTLSVLLRIEDISKTVLLKKKPLLMMTYYVLLITLYRRCYLHFQGYKETVSSIRRKYTLSFRLFNSSRVLTSQNKT